MKELEEKMWNYFDGSLSEEQKRSVQELIATNAEAKKLFESVEMLHSTLKVEELDEPSLSFTRNVMNDIAMLPIPTPLKTRIDKRIIGGIGGFFLITLSLLFVFALIALFRSAAPVSLPDISVSIPSTNWSELFNSNYVLAFMCLNMLLAFIYLDRFLHRKIVERH